LFKIPKTNMFICSASFLSYQQHLILVLIKRVFLKNKIYK